VTINPSEVEDLDEHWENYSTDTVVKQVIYWPKSVTTTTTTTTTTTIIIMS